MIASKECFLHCSLWPKDYCIKIDELVELWMGLGLIDETDIQSAYNVGYTYIGKLRDVCLLEEVEDVQLISVNRGVKLHDVIRDMALWIANDRHSEKNKWIVKAGVYNYKDSMSINIFSETEKLSLMDNNSLEFSLSRTPGSPKMSTLLLNYNNLKSNFLWLEPFIGLIVLDLSNNGLTNFPVEICKLVKLQYLNLFVNLLRSLPEELAALINLKYLLLRGNTIGTIPRGILSKLKALRVLDLSPLFNLEFGTDLEEITLVLTVLEEIKPDANFQALGIAIFNMQEFLKLNENMNIPVRWLRVSIKNTKESLIFSDSFLGNSQMQTNLSCLLIETIDTVNAVHFESKPGSACHFRRLEQLSFMMNHAKHILWKNLNPKDVLSRLQILEFNDCWHLTSISWVAYLPSLQKLTLFNCLSIKQLVDEEYVENYGEIFASCPTFPSLKIIVLQKCLRMENICDPKITFPVLETMLVLHCRRLRKLPFKADNIPPKLRQIQGSPSWWNRIEWEDSSLKTSLPAVLVGPNLRLNSFTTITTFHTEQERAQG